MNQGEKLKELLKKYYSVETIETSTIQDDDGELLLLETCIVNGDIEVVIVSDNKQVVIV